MNKDVGRLTGDPASAVRPMTRFRPVCFSLTALLAAATALTVTSGCIGFAGFDTAALESFFGQGRGLDPTDNGNVVLSYTNRTDREASWTVTWGTGDDRPPTVVTVQTPPQDTSSVSLEGQVRHITLGSKDHKLAAVILGPEGGATHSISAQGSPLVLGEDFQPGDIISFTLTLLDAGQEEYTITTEIISGG